MMNNDPRIEFEKIMCPMCGNPTGPQTNCKGLQPPENVNILIRNGLVSSVFSENCIYRKEYMWLVKTNYEITAKLMQRVEKVRGISAIELGVYEFKICINPMFDELSVKTEISKIYKNYVKEQLPKPKETETILSITLPNGNKIVSKKLNNEDAFLQLHVFQDIRDEISNVEITRMENPIKE